MVPSRRRVLAACGAGLCATAGCLSRLSSPNIPRATQILEERSTIAPGEYRTWNLFELRRGVSLAAEDGVYTFSYEFVVEEVLT